MWRTFSTNIVLGGNVRSMLARSHFTQRPLHLCFPSFFMKHTQGRQESVSLRCWSHLSQVCFSRRSSQVPQSRVGSEDLSARCFWMWDPLMGLWRNLGWDEAVTSCSPWSGMAESMIVQLLFYCKKSVCHFSWDSLRDWFTVRLSNVIQHQVHRLSCRKFKFWSLFSPTY